MGPTYLEWLGVNGDPNSVSATARLPHRQRCNEARVVSPPTPLPDPLAPHRGHDRALPRERRRHGDERHDVDRRVRGRSGPPPNGHTCDPCGAPDPPLEAGPRRCAAASATRRMIITRSAASVIAPGSTPASWQALREAQPRREGNGRSYWTRPDQLDNRIASAIDATSWIRVAARRTTMRVPRLVYRRSFRSSPT